MNSASKGGSFAHQHRVELAQRRAASVTLACRGAGESRGSHLLEPGLAGVGGP